jgi:hypothetical protein
MASANLPRVIPMSNQTTAKRLETFVASEAGAVTVDWVMLTAAILALGIAAVTTVRTGTSSLRGHDQLC